MWLHLERRPSALLNCSYLYGHDMWRDGAKRVTPGTKEHGTRRRLSRKVKKCAVASDAVKIPGFTVKVEKLLKKEEENNLKTKRLIRSVQVTFHRSLPCRPVSFQSQLAITTKEEITIFLFFFFIFQFFFFLRLSISLTSLSFSIAIEEDAFNLKIYFNGLGVFGFRMRASVCDSDWNCSFDY